MKAYFWAKAKGVIIDAEVYQFTLLVNARPIKVAWRTALAAGVGDEMELSLAEGSYRTALSNAIMVPASTKLKRITNPEIHGDAFLTVIDGLPSGRTTKTKYRLVNFSFAPNHLATLCSSGPKEPERCAVEFSVCFTKLETCPGGPASGSAKA